MNKRLAKKVEKDKLLMSSEKKRVGTVMNEGR